MVSIEYRLGQMILVFEIITVLLLAVRLLCTNTGLLNLTNPMNITLSINTTIETIHNMDYCSMSDKAMAIYLNFIVSLTAHQIRIAILLIYQD